MGVATTLGYRPGAANPVQRGVQRVAGTRPAAWVLARVAPPLDRFLHRVGKGRTSAPQLLTGLPTLQVTTTGRRSGQPRTTSLLAVPFGDDLAVLGTRFGQPGTPAWVLNLQAEPRAGLEYRGRRCEAIARAADADEQVAIWATAAMLYGGFAHYRDRVHDRTIRLFVLTEPAPGEQAPS